MYRGGTVKISADKILRVRLTGGSPQRRLRRRLMGVVKEEEVDVGEEDGEDGVRQTQMTYCGAKRTR